MITHVLFKVREVLTSHFIWDQWELQVMQEVLPFLTFFWFVVDRALPCEGTDLCKNKLFSEQENR